jgi:hypothetical protein
VRLRNVAGNGPPSRLGGYTTKVMPWVGKTDDQVRRQCGGYEGVFACDEPGGSLHERSRRIKK